MILRLLTNWKRLLVNHVWVIEVSKEMSLFLFNPDSNIKRVIKIEVNNDVKTPIINVVAKPYTGPEPKAKRIIATNKVVMLLSIIAE